MCEVRVSKSQTGDRGNQTDWGDGNHFDCHQPGLTAIENRDKILMNKRMLLTSAALAALAFASPAYAHKKIHAAVKVTRQSPVVAAPVAPAAPVVAVNGCATVSFDGKYIDWQHGTAQFAWNGTTYQAHTAQLDGGPVWIAKVNGKLCARPQAGTAITELTEKPVHHVAASSANGLLQIRPPSCRSSAPSLRAAGVRTLES